MTDHAQAKRIAEQWTFEEILGFYTAAVQMEAQACPGPDGVEQFREALFIKAQFLELRGFDDGRAGRVLLTQEAMSGVTLLLAGQEIIFSALGMDLPDWAKEAYDEISSELEGQLEAPSAADNVVHLNVVGPAGCEACRGNGMMATSSGVVGPCTRCGGGEQ